MFTIVGVVLTIYGLMTPDRLYERSLGINVNLWWGLVLLVFGIVMFAFALRASISREPPSSGTISEPENH
jgi:drug/metabolite transporter (DMT)-like permease